MAVSITGHLFIWGAHPYGDVRQKLWIYGNIPIYVYRYNTIIFLHFLGDTRQYIHTLPGFAG